MGFDGIKNEFDLISGNTTHNQDVLNQERYNAWTPDHLLHLKTEDERAKMVEYPALSSLAGTFVATTRPLFSDEAPSVSRPLKGMATGLLAGAATFGLDATLSNAVSKDGCGKLFSPNPVDTMGIGAIMSSGLGAKNKIIASGAMWALGRVYNYFEK